MNWETAGQSTPQSTTSNRSSDGWTTWTQQQLRHGAEIARHARASHPYFPNSAQQSTTSHLASDSLPPLPPLVRHGTPSQPSAATNTDVPVPNIGRTAGADPPTPDMNFPHNYGATQPTQTGSRQYGQPQYTSSLTSGYRHPDQFQQYESQPLPPITTFSHQQHPSTMSMGMRHPQFPATRASVRTPPSQTPAQFMSNQQAHQYHQISRTNMLPDSRQIQAHSPLGMTNMLPVNSRNQAHPVAGMTQSRTSPHFLSTPHSVDYQRSQPLQQNSERPPPYPTQTHGYPSTFQNPTSSSTNQSNCTMSQQTMRVPAQAHQPKQCLGAPPLAHQPQRNTGFTNGGNIPNRGVLNITPPSGFQNIAGIAEQVPQSNINPAMIRNTNADIPHNRPQYAHSNTATTNSTHIDPISQQVLTGYALSQVQQRKSLGAGSASGPSASRLPHDRINQYATCNQSVPQTQVDNTSLIRSAFMLPVQPSKPVPAEADDRAMLGRWYAQPSPEKSRNTNVGLRMPTSCTVTPSLVDAMFASDGVSGKLIGSDGANRNVAPAPTATGAEISVQRGSAKSFQLIPSICTEEIIEYKVIDLLRCFSTKQARSRHASSVDSARSAAESQSEMTVPQSKTSAESLERDGQETSQLGVEAGADETEKSSEDVNKHQMETCLEESEDVLEKNRKRACDELILHSQFEMEGIMCPTSIFQGTASPPLQPENILPEGTNADFHELSRTDVSGLLSLEASHEGENELNIINTWNHGILETPSNVIEFKKQNGELEPESIDHAADVNTSTDELTRSGQKRSHETVEFGDDAVTPPAKRSRGRGRGRSKCRGSTRGRGRGRGGGGRWSAGSTACSTPRNDKGRGNRGGGVKRGLRRGRVRGSRSRGQSRGLSSERSISSSEVLNPENPLLALKKFLEKFGPNELETGTMDLKSVKELLDLIPEEQLQALTPAQSAALSAIKNEPNRSADVSMAGLADVEMDIADDSTLHPTEATQDNPKPKNTELRSPKVTKGIEYMDIEMDQVSVGSIPERFSPNEHAISPKTKSSKLPSPKEDKKSFVKSQENETLVEKSPKPRKCLAEEFNDMQDCSDSTTKNADKMPNNESVATDETETVNPESASNTMNLVTEIKQGATNGNTETKSDLSQTYRVSDTHQMTWVRFHGKTATYLINPTGKYFILTELLRRCFRIEGADKKKQRADILDLKKNVLKIPDRKLEPIFYNVVVNNLTKREVIRTIPAQFAIISEGDASMLFHYKFKRQFCNQVCVGPFYSKKDMAETSSDVQIINSQSISSSTFTTKQSGSPQTKCKSETENSKSSENFGRNIFDIIPDWKGSSTKATRTKKGKNKTLKSEDFIDLCSDNEETSDGYETDTTLPYVDGKPMKRLEEVEEELNNTVTQALSDEDVERTETIALNTTNSGLGIESADSVDDEKDESVKNVAKKEKISDELEENVIIIDEETDNDEKDKGVIVIKDNKKKGENKDDGNDGNINDGMIKEDDKEGCETSSNETKGDCLVRNELEKPVLGPETSLNEQVKVCEPENRNSTGICKFDNTDLEVMHHLAEKIKETQNLCNNSHDENDSKAVCDEKIQYRSTESSQLFYRGDETYSKESEKNIKTNEDDDGMDDVIILGETPAYSSNLNTYRSAKHDDDVIDLEKENEEPCKLEIEINLDEDIIIEESDIPLIPLDCDITADGPKLFLDAEKKLNKCIERANRAQDTMELSRVCREVMAMTEPLQNWTKAYLNQYEQGILIEAQRLKRLEQLSISDLTDTFKYPDIEEVLENSSDRDNGE